ncbi:cell wall hydrolase [Bacillus carboniphilus]|uniref:Cell wall hydrolase n=1 Tax=Bacillus carboniphilus TaxID=86663 RepID=A0ABP3GEJ4_9BACI
MNKFLIFLMTITLIIGSFSMIPAVHISAQTKEDTVQLFDIDLDSVEEDEKVNLMKTLSEKKENLLKSAVEDKEDPVYKLSKEEKKLLARLVHAEAKGEPFEGKVAVATVVINRVEDEKFPDTLKEVIYQKNAFQPVQNGSINEPADKEAKEAVKEALDEYEKANEDVLYFYNPDTATSDWIFDRKVIEKIGRHAFAI